jgi:ribonuclease P protein component
MIPAARRMRRSVDFERAVRGGTRAGRPTVVVHLVRDTDRTDGPLVGLVVSKAVGHAVHRNLVKRRLRTAAAQRIDALPDDTLVVLRALPRALDVDYPHLERDVTSGIDRALDRAPRPIR